MHHVASQNRPATQLRIAMVLASFMNTETGEAWPSQNTIAGITGISRDNVAAGIAGLVRSGLIAKIKIGRSLRYQLILPETGVSADTFQLEEKIVQPNTFAHADDNPDDLDDLAKGVQLDSRKVFNQMVNRCVVEHPDSEDSEDSEAGGANAPASPSGGFPTLLSEARSSAGAAAALEAADLIGELFGQGISGQEMAGVLALVPTPELLSALRSERLWVAKQGEGRPMSEWLDARRRAAA